MTFLEALEEGIDFDVKTHASYFLSSLRHRLTFQLMQEVISRYPRFFDHQDTELFFLRWSTRDPDFDLLLPYRDRFYKEIHKLIKSRYGIENFSELPPSEKVNKITMLVMGLIMDDLPYGSNSTGSTMEDLLISRVYAQEQRIPHRLITYSIIQKVASFYGVETILSTLFLNIYDPRFQAGQSYLYIDGREYWIRGKDPVLQFLNNASGYLEPLSQNEIYDILEGAVLDSIPTSRYEFGINYNCIHSSASISSTDKFYFRSIFDAFSLIEITNSEEQYDHILDDIFMLAMKIFPGDIVTIGMWSMNFGRRMYLERFNLEEFLRQRQFFWMDSLANYQHLGKFVESDQEVNVVLNSTNSVPPNQGFESCVTLDREGQIKVSYHRLSRFVKSRQDIDEYLDSIPTAELGWLFSKVDYSTGRLVPNKRFENLLDRYDK